MDNLNTQIPFGYAVTQKVTVDQISPDKIDIKSPVIQDELGNNLVRLSPFHAGRVNGNLCPDVQRFPG